MRQKIPVYRGTPVFFLLFCFLFLAAVVTLAVKVPGGGEVDEGVGQEGDDCLPHKAAQGLPDHIDHIHGGEPGADGEHDNAQNQTRQA